MLRMRLTRRGAPGGRGRGGMANAPLWTVRVALDGVGLGEESEVSSARAQGVRGKCRTMTLIRRKPPAEARDPGAAPRASVKPNRGPHGAGMRSG